MRRSRRRWAITQDDQEAAPEAVAVRIARWKAGDPDYLNDASAAGWRRRNAWWRRWLFRRR